MNTGLRFKNDSQMSYKMQGDVIWNVTWSGSFNNKNNSSLIKKKAKKKIEQPSIIVFS